MSIQQPAFTARALTLEEINRVLRLMQVGAVAGTTQATPTSLQTGSGTVTIASAPSSPIPPASFLTVNGEAALPQSRRLAVEAAVLTLTDGGNLSSLTIGTKAFTGDATTPINSFVLTLATTGVTAGAYGDATHIPTFTVDAKGRVTLAATSAAPVVPQSRLINTSAPLTGGGDLTADRTIAFSNQTANTFLAGPTAGAPAYPTFRAINPLDLPGNFSGFANPTASVGLTAVNGVATTAMRSDAAPPIDQGIAPTWTGIHTFSNATASTSISTGAVVISTGGLGVGGASFFGGNITRTGTGVTIILNTSTSSGTGDAASNQVKNNTGVIAVFNSYSSAFSASLWGSSRSSSILFGAAGTNPTNVFIGNAAGNSPVIFGINVSEVARFSGGTLASDSFSISYNKDATSSTVAAFTSAGGIAAVKSGIFGLGVTGNANNDFTAVSNIPTWVKTTLTFTSFSAAATTNSITLASLVAGGVIHAVKIKHSTAFSGGTITAYTISVGVSGNTSKYASAFDVFQTIGNTVFQFSNSVGTENHGAATNILATATSTGANLNAATAGSVDIWLLVSKAV